MEKKGILGPTSGRRPGDVTIPLWSQGKGLAIDVAVTSPFNRKAVRSSSPCEDYAAQQKHGKYDASFRGKNYLFAAVVFETTGAINEEGARVLSQLARGSQLRGKVASLVRFAVVLGSGSRATFRGPCLRRSSIVSRVLQ